MASIISRNNRYCVVCSYVDEQGNRKQKWQSFKTLPEAKARKTEIEYSQQLGTFTIPNSATVSELLTEYVSLYGKTKWSISAYTSNMSLIRHYIEPLIGSVKLKEITVRTLEKYYQTLLKIPAVHKATDRKSKKSSSLVTPATIHKVHNLLRSAFNQAEKWDLIEKNPARYATIPKEETKKRDIWDAQTLFKAIDCCEDDRLKLCMNVAFACSLRIGELLGLTWDCVDISEESIMAGKAYIYVNKELQRVSKSTDQYSHILDENRRANAQLIEKAFYGRQGVKSLENEQSADTQVADQAQAAGMDIEQLMKILSNPEMVNMLKMLSKSMG